MKPYDQVDDRADVPTIVESAVAGYDGNTGLVC
jgi:hypothetical protein